jgi:uncharacterized membrane protein YjjB (DUF3815 family)
MNELLYSFAGSLCAGVLFNAKRNRLIWIGFSGAVAWFAFYLLRMNNGSLVFATFVGAVAVGIYSETAAILLKSPATIFSIPGIFPLVPGIAAYTTVQYIVENKLTNAANEAVATIASAGAIAFGIMVVYATFRFFQRLWRPEKKKLSAKKP